MQAKDHEALAAELDQAEQTRTQVAHFSKRFPDITIEDGYAIQRAWVQRKLARGRHIIGHKIGLTSRAMQMASNVTEPDYGALLDDMLFAEGGDIPLERFIVPRVEVELAFILARPLRGPGLNATHVLAATEYVVPAIEIIDARIMQKDPATGDTRKVFDTIADNAANAGVVPGGRPVKPDAVDLRWVGTLLYKNGVIEETGLAAGVLNHPATGVAWLANRLAMYDQGLEAGELVLAGSFTRPVFGSAGDTFHADYGPLGNIAFRFV
ncbi:MAG: 2-oxo-hepta-3-ene-1,7-dioic acid hydratase [Burkholderiaceae bacterium]